MQEANDQIVKEIVEHERISLPMLGTRKLYHLIKEQLKLANIKLGRDKLFNLLRNHDMLIEHKRRYIQTTMSKHWMRKYPNLVKDMKINRAEQVWVTDITYLKTDEGSCYLNLVTDAFSRKIMGYVVSESMETCEMKKALEMALKNRKYKNPIIHHSDRGSQYCSSEYVGLANKNNMQMSMTEQSDPYENALAERMNKTLKEEFGLGLTIKSRQLAKLLVEEAVYLYNTKRPHLSLQMKTPEQVH